MPKALYFSQNKSNIRNSDIGDDWYYSGERRGLFFLVTLALIFNISNYFLIGWDFIFKRSLSLTLAIIIIIGGVVALVFTNTIYAMASEDNPFLMMDRARDENINIAKEKAVEQDFLKKNLSLDKMKQKEMDLLASQGHRYIVRFNENVSMQQIFEIVKSYKYQLIGNSEQRLFMIELIERQDFERRATGLVEYIEEDKQIEIQAIPSDPYYKNQWALPAMNMPQAWDITTGSNSVLVAVIDSGVYRDQPDLTGADIRKGWDYIFDEDCDWDSCGHGTNVAGIIGAQTNNAIGIAGINWNVAIVPLRTLSTDGKGLVSNEISAIYDAADAGCAVINISLGAEGYLSAENTAIQYAISKGCIVVASAGNDGTSTYNYPASYNGVISVASIDSNLSYSSFSQFNDKVDVAAPGRNIYTTAYWIDAGGYEYEYVDGTSFSAPYVSGIAALMAACKPGITTAEFSDALKVSCTDLGTTGFDNHYGYGLINAEKILQNLMPVTLQSIAITNPPTKLIYTVGDTIDISGLIVTGTYSDNSTKIESITIANITGFNSSVPTTNQIITITINGKVTTYKVHIITDTANTDTTGMTDMKPGSSATVKSDKIWAIKLNGLVNESSIKNKIYITNAQGIKQATTCSVTSVNGVSQILVKPNDNYSSGKYILWVRDIASIKGTKLKNQVFLNFSIPTPAFVASIAGTTTIIPSAAEVTVTIPMAGAIYYTATGTNGVTSKLTAVNAKAGVWCAVGGTVTLKFYASADETTLVGQGTVTRGDAGNGSEVIAVTNLSVSPSIINMTVGGAIGNIVPTISPANATNKTVTYSSSNTSIAAVSATGVVTPVAAGTAIITATASGKTATCLVIVNAASSTGTLSNPLPGKNNIIIEHQKYSFYSAKKIIITVEEVITGATANSLAQSENMFNDKPTSSQEWRFYIFNLKYVSGASSNDKLDASDVIFKTYFYNLTGSSLPIYDMATLGDRYGAFGIFNVRLFPGASSKVVYGLLTDKSAGNALLQVPYSSGKKNTWILLTASN